jgi:hypothetical protein
MENESHFIQLEQYATNLPEEEKEKFKQIGEKMYNDLDHYTKDYESGQKYPQQNYETLQE